MNGARVCSIVAKKTSTDCDAPRPIPPGPRPGWWGYPTIVEAGVVGERASPRIPVPRSKVRSASLFGARRRPERHAEPWQREVKARGWGVGRDCTSWFGKAQADRTHREKTGRGAREKNWRDLRKGAISTQPITNPGATPLQ